MYGADNVCDPDDDGDTIPDDVEIASLAAATCVTRRPQPFFTYQLGGGWFVRSQPLRVFDWKNDTQLVPLDLGVGRVVEIAGQHVSWVIESSWHVVHNDWEPGYGIRVGVAFLYPGVWRGGC